MGRGSRAPSTLALAPLGAPQDAVWVDILTKLEYDTFHSPHPSPCSVPYPYGEMHFVVINERHLTSGPNHHTFTYFDKPDVFLKALVTIARTPTDRYTYVLERRTALKKFNFITHSLHGVLGGYTPDFVEWSKDREKRLRVITDANNLNLNNYDDYNRFLILLVHRLSGTVSLRPTSSFTTIENLGKNLFPSDYAFLAAYDLDVSDQPLPLRFTLEYVDSNGDTHTYVEPL